MHTPTSCNECMALLLLNMFACPQLEYKVWLKFFQDSINCPVVYSAACCYSTTGNDRGGRQLLSQYFDNAIVSKTVTARRLYIQRNVSLYSYVHLPVSDMASTYSYIKHFLELLDRKPAQLTLQSHGLPWLPCFNSRPQGYSLLLLFFAVHAWSLANLCLIYRNIILSGLKILISPFVSPVSRYYPLKQVLLLNHRLPLTLCPYMRKRCDIMPVLVTYATCRLGWFALINRRKGEDLNFCRESLWNLHRVLLFG